MPKSNIFSDHKLFQSQKKEDWKRKIKGRNIISRYKNKIYDPIYFKGENINMATFNTDNDWDITVEIFVEKKGSPQQPPHHSCRSQLISVSCSLQAGL